MKLFLTTVAAAALTSTLALADDHRGNSGRAGDMADTLSGTPGIGGAAPSVSGSDSKSDSGWGNAGSREVTGEGDPDAEVSQQGGTRGRGSD